MFFLFACEEELLSPVDGKSDANLEFSTKSVVVPSGAGYTTLGAEMTNPYSLKNINAAANLIGKQGPVNPSHYYLKVSPSTGQHMADLESFFDSLGYDFDWQPIHREVLYEGDEGYLPEGDTSVWKWAPEYGAIKAKDLKTFPNIPYDVLDVMYIPPYTTMLTYTAFVISGNERFYEAVDGYCHPDCPSWPACLDNSKEADICVPERPQNVGESVLVRNLQQKQNFPNYLLDTRMGYNGESAVTTCDDILNQRPECDLGCTAILEQIPSEPDGACLWTCDCPDDDGDDDDGGGDDDNGGPGGDDGNGGPGDGDGNGGNPPDGQVANCGCFVDGDERKPAGRMILQDNQLGDEGIRHAKVKTTKYHWGFLWRVTVTDENGCWQINKRYNVKKMKAKLVFKDKVFNRMTIRSLRGIRFWNTFLKPVKHTFRRESGDKVWNNLCLRVFDIDNNNSRMEETYVAAITNNGVHEYYDDYGSYPSPGKISILIHQLSDELNSAPMFRRIDRNEFSTTEIEAYFAAFSIGGPIVGTLYTYWEIGKPDVFLSYGDDSETDRQRRTVYHEMTHVSQFDRVGSNWWRNYHTYLFDVATTCLFCAEDNPNRQRPPYGNGDLVGHELAEVTEGMARSVDRWMSDLKYGLNYSAPSPTPQDARYVNQAEQLTFWDGPTQFIPQGLFFDLYDVNNSFPSTVTASEPGSLVVIDAVGSYSFEQQLSALNITTNTIDDLVVELIE